MTARLLEHLLGAHADAATAVDNAGHTPVHLLVKTLPDASEDVWAPLLRAANVTAPPAGSAVASAGSAKGSSSAKGSGAPPVMLAADGKVKGFAGKVRNVVDAVLGLERELKPLPY